MTAEVKPAKRDELLSELKAQKEKFDATKAEHDTPKVGGHYGPMDDTPWTATGERMFYIKQKIEELTKELGEEVRKEKLGF
jgi:hypothetical protein